MHARVICTFALAGLAQVLVPAAASSRGLDGAEALERCTQDRTRITALEESISSLWDDATIERTRVELFDADRKGELIDYIDYFRTGPEQDYLDIVAPARRVTARFGYTLAGGWALADRDIVALQAIEYRMEDALYAALKARPQRTEAVAQIARHRANLVTLGCESEVTSLSERAHTASSDERGSARP